MKHLSTALIALSLFAASSAVHAQTSLFGTDFDGTTTYPYTDGTIYGGTGFPDLNGVGGFTATPVYADTTFDNTGTNVVGQLYSGNGTAFASHALNSPAFGGGYSFDTDFQIANNAGAAGNDFSFSLTGTAGTILTVNFASTGLSGGVQTAFAPQLIVNGLVVATATTGPVIDQNYHLNITVSNTGDIVASLGTAASTITYSDPGLTATVSGFSVGETDTSVSTGNDYVAFDNVSLTVPEPSTYAMMGLGLVGMLGLMKFRRSKA